MQVVFKMGKMHNRIYLSQPYTYLLLEEEWLIQYNAEGELHHQLVGKKTEKHKKARKINNFQLNPIHVDAYV